MMLTTPVAPAAPHQPQPQRARSEQQESGGLGDQERRQAAAVGEADRELAEHRKVVAQCGYEGGCHQRELAGGRAQRAHRLRSGDEGVHDRERRARHDDGGRRGRREGCTARARGPRCGVEARPAPR